MFILVDDKNRENEGDLVVPGSKCNSRIINLWLNMDVVNLFGTYKKTNR